VIHRHGWLFSGQRAKKPIGMRQLCRIVVGVAQATDIAKRIPATSVADLEEARAD